MRAPRQPKKPRKLTGPTDRDGGGELRRPRPSAEDYIPTAPMVPLDDEWDADEWEAEDWASGDWNSAEAGDSAASEDPEAEDLEPVEMRRERGRAEDPGTLARPGAFSRLMQSARAAGGELRGRLASRRADEGELDARRVERKREARRVRLRRAGLGAGVVGLLALLAWIVLASPLLRYQYSTDQISGYAETSIVNRTQLEQLVAAHDGQNLVLLDAEALAGDIRDIPEVASATVTKDYRHALRIEITESVPVACLGPKDSCSAVTADGTKLTVPPEVAAGLPRIGASDGLDPAEAISDGLEVLSALDQAVLAQVTEVSVAKGNLVTLNLTEGRQVYWGSLERGEFKAQVLAVLLTQQASFFDVSVPDAPVSR